MFFIYIGTITMAVVIFGVALVLLIGSLGLLIWEIQISTRALDLHLGDMED
jgi:nitrate reductase NapE component